MRRITCHKLSFVGRNPAESSGYVLFLQAGFFLFLLSAACTNGATGTENESHIISQSGSGRASAYSGANKIITRDGKTHVAWLDSEQDGFFAKIRTFDQSAQEWSETTTLGDAFDNHGGPSITVDSQGYLHAVYYPHHHEMRYRKSTFPNDASAWEDEIQFGDNLTYPTLMVGPDDTLYMTARQSFSNEPWQTSLYSKPPDGDWSEPTAIIKGDEIGYSQFAESLAWSPDHQTIHLAARMYGETPQWAYKIAYMKSEDYGQSWSTYDGTPITFPAMQSTIETVQDTDPSLRSSYGAGDTLSGGHIAVDANNVPHILYSDLSPGATLPHQAWLASPDGQGGWNKMLINDKISVLPQGWGLTAGGGIHINEEGHISLALTLVDDLTETATFGVNSNEVVWAESTDGGNTFTSQIISPNDPELPSWLPSLERPTGFNSVQDPSLLYTYGEKGSSNGEILENDVILWAPFSTDPWNEVLGDVNQNGVFEGDGTLDATVDDVSAFVEGWLWKQPTEFVSSKQHYLHGDLNFDGETDLADLFLMRSYLRQNNVSDAALMAMIQHEIPEPSGVTLTLFCLVAFCQSRNTVRELFLSRG